jgi:hypothetical protein
MIRKLLFLTLIVFTSTAAKADERQKIATKVQKVILFLNGAQVTRTAMVSVAAGTSTLVFENLSPGIDVPSIQVHAEGEFTILSVKHELNFLNEQLKVKQIEELRQAQKAIKDKITFQNDLLSVYREEENMLTKNQVVTGENASLDVAKLKQALDFQAEELTGLKKKEQAVNDLIASLTLEQSKYDNEIAEITKGSSTATSDILVTVSSKTALRSEFSISYVVHNASWFPTYDIRAKNVNSPISISYKANVSQQCGEEWKNIKLTLSTGNPSVSGSKPELSPYYLNYGMVYASPAGTITSVSGKVFDNSDRSALPGASVKIKGTSIGTVTDVNGNFTIQTPTGAQTIEISYIGYESQDRQINGTFLNVGLKPSQNSLNEVVVVGYSTSSREDGYSEDVLKKVPGISVRGFASIPIAVNQTENQTNVEFNIENPYTIPSDGKQYTVEISQTDLKASYQYAVAPKLSTDVFLTAQLTDWNKYNFLSGEANLFFEGTYIGKSLLDTHATNDTLNLSLGADKNIVVTRVLQKDLSQKQSIGSNKKETKDWLIAIKNRKNEVVNLLVEDQVPVSQNSAIEVEVQETSGVKPDPLTGKISWTVLLNPLDDKKIELKYQVKYPKNQTVIVQ